MVCPNPILTNKIKQINILLVAEHINEMQRINEEYGTIFENLIASTKVNSKKNSMYLYDLTPISLIHVSSIVSIQKKDTNILFNSVWWS